MQTFTKFTCILGLSALGLATISCDTTGQEVFTEEMRALRAVSANILIHEDFEGSDAWNQVHKQFGTEHAFNVAEDPRDRSNKAGRFELRFDDPIQSNGKRSEVLFPRQAHHDRWYSYSVLIPTIGYATDSNREIISQWHQSTGGPPTISIKVNNDRFFLRTGPTAEERKDYDLGPVEKDVWHDFTYHIIHSAGSDGLIEIWKNGEKIITLNGANMYDMDLPRWKVGIYKSTWQKRATDTDVRVIFFDNVKLGNENVSLEEMASGRNSNQTLQSTPDGSKETSDNNSSDNTTDESSSDNNQEEKAEEEKTHTPPGQEKTNKRNDRKGTVNSKWNR